MIISVCVYVLYVGAHMLQCACGGQSWLSPPTRLTRQALYLLSHLIYPERLFETVQRKHILEEKYTSKIAVKIALVLKLFILRFFYRYY